MYVFLAKVSFQKRSFNRYSYLLNLANKTTSYLYFQYMTTIPKHYSLTTKQQTILNLLYRFRFATSEQLSKALNVTKASINKRLKLLLEQELIDRKYNRISREYAAYYLSTKGINELKKISKQKYLPKVLRNARRDGENSAQFISHCLGVFDVYNKLRASYGDELQFFTKSQMAAVAYFPKQLPDAHVQLGASDTKLFLLELVNESQPFFLATRAIIRYINYADKGDWPSQYEFPKLLVVCDSVALQKRLVKKMQYKIDNLDNDEISVYITNLNDLGIDKWYTFVEQDIALPLSQT